MKWKSFKDEKPLNGQRVLIYNPKENPDCFDPFEVAIMEENKLHGFREFYPIKDYCLWISVPNLPKDVK